MTASKKNIEQGIANRARIEAALLAAGERGMSPAELSLATGIRGRACNYQCAQSLNVFHAKVLASYKCRWYHLRFADAGRAYVAKSDDPSKERVRWSAETQARALQCVVDAGTDGVDAQTVAAAIGRNPENVRGILVALFNAGSVAWVWNRQTKLYFTPENLPPAKPKREVRLPKQPKVRVCKTPVRSMVLALIESAGAAGICTHGLVEQSGLSMGAVNAATARLCESGAAKWAHDRTYSRSRPRRYWGAAFDVIKPKQIAGKDLVSEWRGGVKVSRLQWADAEPIIPKGVKVTRAKKPVDRFHVDRPQPLFSSLPFGTYLPADTWSRYCA